MVTVPAAAATSFGCSGRWLFVQRRNTIFEEIEGQLDRRLARCWPPLPRRRRKPPGLCCLYRSRIEPLGCGTALDLDIFHVSGRSDLERESHGSLQLRLRRCQCIEGAKPEN